MAVRRPRKCVFVLLVLILLLTVWLGLGVGIAAAAPQYQYVRTIRVGGPTSTQNYTLPGVAVDSSGGLFVSGSDQGVLEIDPMTGTILGAITYPAYPDVLVPMASWGLGFAPGGLGPLWVTDWYWDHVFAFGTATPHAQQASLPFPRAVGELANARAVDVDSAGSVYVLLRKADNTDSVLKYVKNEDGSYTQVTTSEGPGQPGWPITRPAEFRAPAGVAVDQQGYVYVACTDASKIFKFDADGNYVTSWASQEASGIDIDAAGLVYATDFGRYNSINKQVFVYSPAGPTTPMGDYPPLATFGNAQLSTGNPEPVAVGPDGKIYVVDTYNKTVVIFQKDDTTPSVNCALAGPTGVNGPDTGWFTGSVTAHISGTDPDPGDGVFGIEWELYANSELLDSGQASERSTLDVTVPGGDGAPDGIYTLRVRVEDTHNNWSDWVDTPVQIDTIPPVTSFSRLDEGGGWWWTDAPFSLTATDIDGSEVARSEYQVKPVTVVTPEPSAWLPTDGIYGVASGEGEHTLFYRSVDVAGNVEDPQTTWIGIDSQEPVITIFVPSLAAAYFQGSVVPVSYVTSDATSKVANSYASVDNSEDNIASGDPLPTDDLGDHHFTVWAVDYAGHWAERTIDYTVVAASSDVTPPTLVLGPAVYDGAAYGVSLLGQPLDFSVVDESGGSGASINGSASVLVPGTPTPQTIPLAWTTNANGTTSASGTLPTGVAGAYTLTLSGRDQAGNLVTKTLTYYAAGTASPIAGLGGLPRDANGTPLLDVTKYSPTKFLTLSFTLLDSAGKPVNNASPRLYVYDTATGSQRFRALLPFAPLGKGKYVFLWFPRLLKWDPSWPHDYRDMQLIIKFYDKTSGKLVTATVKQGADGALVATPLAATGAKAATTTPPTTPTTTSSKIRVRW